MVDEDIMPIKRITEKLQEEGFDITHNKMLRYTEPSRNINFPEPVEQLGRYKFYSYQAVERWLTLWMRATEKQTEGQRLNGTR